MLIITTTLLARFHMLRPRNHERLLRSKFIADLIRQSDDGAALSYQLRNAQSRIEDISP